MAAAAQKGADPAASDVSKARPRPLAPPQPAGAARSRPQPPTNAGKWNLFQIGEGPLANDPLYQVESGSIALIFFSVLVLAGAVVVSILLATGMETLTPDQLAKAASCGTVSHQVYETRGLCCADSPDASIDCSPYLPRAEDTEALCKAAIPHYWSDGCVMFPGAHLFSRLSLQ